MNITNFNRVDYNWDTVEKELGYTIYENYKILYETLGSFGIDDFIYIVSPIICDLMYGIKEFNKQAYETYLVLEKHLEEDRKIIFYDGKEGWMPVGYTTNSDFIFCNSSQLMITDAGFDDREIYEISLLEFIDMYLNDKLNYKIFPDDLIETNHIIEILNKESYFKSK